jgi:hypothetical protein
VKIMNANWDPDEDGPDGHFQLMLITEDDERHIIPASAGSVTAVVALAGADTVMAWDPENRTLIVANIIGEMPWTIEPRAGTGGVSPGR